MKPHKHASVIRAWADGAMIEYRNGLADTWRACPDPLWGPECHYRVRPSNLVFYAALVDVNGDFYLESADGNRECAIANSAGNRIVSLLCIELDSLGQFIVRATTETP